MNTKERAERTLDILHAILAHYSGPSGRQVGHTATALNGARNTPGARVVVHDERMARVIRQLTQDKTGCITLLQFEEEVRGTTGPIVWDNAALLTLLDRCSHIIGDLLEEAARPETGIVHDVAHRKEGE